MLSTKSLTLTLLSLAATALAQGNAYITNDCTSTVYFQHVDQNGAGPISSIAAGGYYTEPISTVPGVRLMVWNSSDTTTSPAELDYTLSTTGDYQFLFYNLGSEMDSDFVDTGFGIIPSNVDGVNCVWDFCDAGDMSCANAAPTYHTCPVGSDVNLYVCSGPNYNGGS